VLFHVTYRDRAGAIQTGRAGCSPRPGWTPSQCRSAAISAASFRYGVSRSAILSAVRINPPAQG